LFGAFREVGEAALEEALLRPWVGLLEGACIGGARFAVSAEPLQQVGACRVEVVELEPVE